MDFFEADEPEPSPRRSRPEGSRPRRRRRAAGRRLSREVVVRRLIALGVALLVLLLIVLAVRGCLNARKQRAFDDYLRDLSALVANTNQLSQEFFGALRDPGNVNEAQLIAQVNSYRGVAEDLLRRTEGLGHPDELSAAQDDLVLAYELRAEAIRGVAGRLKAALGRKGRAEAVDAIVEDMRVLLASDVLYRRAREEIERVLREQEISGEVPQSVFLSDPTNWLDQLGVGTALARLAGMIGAAGQGVHGTEIGRVLIRPGGTELNPDSPVTVDAGGQPEIEVSVVNGGDQQERDVLISYELSGAGVSLSGSATIPRIPPGDSRSERLPLDGELPTGEELILTVVVQPVPGEEITENNRATYPIVFE